MYKRQVLDGEEAEEKRVDHLRRRQRPGRAAVDRLRHRQVADEGDRIKERAQETEIDDHAQQDLSLIHISGPTRPDQNSYAVFCLKKKNHQHVAAPTLIHTHTMRIDTNTQIAIMKHHGPDAQL